MSEPEVGPNTAPGPAPVSATGIDRVVLFTVPSRDARGRVVRMGPALNDILSKHAYPPPLARLLAEALVLTALLGATFRGDEGEMTLQAQARGGLIDLLVCDYRAGAVRGYVSFDAERAGEIAEGLTLQQLFGEGYLAITLDQTASQERYQGIVPLEGTSLAEAAESYFDNSEQIPTLVRLAGEDAGDGWIAGGLLVQHLPRAEADGPRLHVAREEGWVHPDWQHVQALAATVRADELTDPALPLEELLWRLFNEDEPRAEPGVGLSRGCRCSNDYIRSVLARFPEEERVEMRGPDGRIGVDCAFCAHHFSFDL